MKISRNLWNNVILVMLKDPLLTHTEIKLIFGISNLLAKQIIFAHLNKHTIKSLPSMFLPTNKCLVLADVHIPFQDDIALECIWDYVKGMDIGTVIILGDMLDFYQISSFTKNPLLRDIYDLIQLGKQFLILLRQRFPNANIKYKQGNHLARLKRYIWEQAPKLSTLLGLSLLQLKLGLDELGILYHVLPFKIGNLWFLHGHLLNGGRSNALNVVNLVFRAVNDNFMVGHYHRAQLNTFRRIDNTVFFGYSLGYLAKLMDYAILNKWIQSFALIDFNLNGKFTTDIKKIVNGEIY